MAELTPKILREAMEKLRNAPPPPLQPRLIFHPETARRMTERGYMNENGTICWDKIVTGMRSAEGPESIIIDIVIDGQRCIYIADAADDGI